MRIFTITTNDAGQRLDKFLTKLMPSMPKGMLYKLIRKKDIRLNQARCKGTEILREGDTVRIFAKEEFFANHSNLHFMPASGKPDLLYEDDSILIAYKKKAPIFRSRSIPLRLHSATALTGIRKVWSLQPRQRRRCGI